MGVVHFGVPERLVEWFKKTNCINTFVETGTFRAGTTIWAAQRFSRVISIEADQELFTQAKDKLRNLKNVELILAESQDGLHAVMNRVGELSLFWLDAHWCGESTAGEEFQCPILEEIDAIDVSDIEHIILIDDARLFLNSPLPPLKSDQWPDIGKLFAALKKKHGDSYIIVLNDVIIRVPARLRDPLERFINKEELRFNTSWKVRSPIFVANKLARSVMRRIIGTPKQ